MFSRIGMQPKTYMLIITAVALAVMLLNWGIATLMVLLLYPLKINRIRGRPHLLSRHFLWLDM